MVAAQNFIDQFGQEWVTTPLWEEYQVEKIAEGYSEDDAEDLNPWDKWVHKETLNKANSMSLQDLIMQDANPYQD